MENTNTNPTANGTNKLVIVLSRGLDDERATVAWTMANAGISSELEVTMFLVSAGVDVVRKGAPDLAQMNPLDPPLKQLIGDFMSRGGTVWACPPCAKLRGYTEESFIEGVKITGAGPLHALLREGAASLTF
jgi:predicted peroxiredoxin